MTIRPILILLGSLFLNFSAVSQEAYQVTINLKVIKKDQVKVTYQLPKTDKNEIEFRIPKIVPGTYSISDFGRFISDFQAFDSEGNRLETTRITDNRILIKEAQRLSRISYWVDDTFDAKSKNIIFEPAGTNIEEGKNFVLNTFGFVGYLQGMKDLPYALEVIYPQGMYGASALEKKSLNDSIDLYSAPNYFDLADGPIMYAQPDTTSFDIGKTKILIAVYSPNHVLDPVFVKEQIEPTLYAQKAYLGELPVDRYAFIIYLFDREPLSGALGALEHSYSSFYSLPEIQPERLAQVIRGVAAHEFFHILTPLNIHSEEIGSFDFIDPKMSKHLWLYEGATEYAAGLAQVKYGDMSLDQYLDVLNQKLATSQEDYNDTLPFTELSLKCLGETKDQYGNVYEKGALIGMALDLKLLELSGGEYGIQDLTRDLSKKYGKHKSFKDNELFDVITALTYPEIRDFFATYVEGDKPLPYADIFAKAGIIYTPGKEETVPTLGGIEVEPIEIESDDQLVITSIDPSNAFAKDMKYKEGDIFAQLDGVKITPSNYNQAFQAYRDRHQEGDKVTAIVLRLTPSGRLKKVKLKGKVRLVDVALPASITPNPKATPAQLALRKSWLNK